MTKKKELIYKIENNVPVIRSVRWDDNLPEYVTMLAMKVGQSFAFKRDRVKFVHNSRVYIRKRGLNNSYVATSVESFKKNPKLMEGRCWRVQDGNRRTYAPRKVRATGSKIDLKEKE
jgi:hypothetical protein